MRALKICLWVVGVLCLLAVLGLLLPLSFWERMASKWGDEPIPKSPMFDYMVRQVSATYVLIGVFFIMIARDPLRYAAFVRLAGFGGIAMGVACFIAGCAVGLPLQYYAGDAVFSVLLGALIVWLLARASAAQAAAEAVEAEENP